MSKHKNYLFSIRRIKLFHKTVACLTAVTVAASVFTPAANVQAAQEETTGTKEKQYIVYIDLPDETESLSEVQMPEPEQELEGVPIADWTTDEENVPDIASDDTESVSSDTVSGDSAQSVEQDTQEEQTEQTADEAVWQEIEEAQQLMEASADSAELSNNDSAIVYEADLTKKELKKLQQSDADIYVEENIELSGAAGKQKDKKTAGRENAKEISSKFKGNKGNQGKGEPQSREEMPEQTGSEENEETEWNIRMVHGDVTEQLQGEPVKVAIMDSGIELLSGIPVEGIVDLVKTEQDIPYYVNDMSGHGTAVAGIVSDIAQDAKIYCVKVMDGDNKASLSSVIEGIYWCIDHDINIINMSFGTSVRSKILQKAIQDAADAGILIVSSAGNGGNEGVEYPAAFEEVVAVGAVDTSAHKTEESAVGEEVELAAPGEQIMADSMLGLKTVVSGTSMAAPHVTGAAAVLWQKDQTKEAAFIRGLLRESANDIGNADEYGNGLIDLQFALAHYDEYAAAYEKWQWEIKQAQQNQDTQEVSKIEVSGQTGEDVQLLDEGNHVPIDTQEEIDYVEGRWTTEMHKKLIDFAIDNYGMDFDDYIIKIFKEGMAAPDATENTLKVIDNNANKCWHGGAINYISNYRFATLMAKYAGDTSKYKKMEGQRKASFDQMRKQVTSKKVGNMTYAKLLSDVKDKKNRSYNNLSSKEKEKWRRIFLYGMAAHILSDTFAHSAYKRVGNEYISLKISKSDDTPSVCPNRFIDAQRGVAQTLYHYINQDLGDELDFAPSMEYWGKSRDYYLRKVLDCALDARCFHTIKEVKTAYKAIHCDPKEKE